MPEALVIVESPAKARTLGKYLGKDYTVKASMGHIADLPSGQLGIDLEHDFEPTFVTLPDRDKILKELRAAVKKADTVYLAPDPDREGEAIAFHLKEKLKLPNRKALRVTFNEITPQAVLEAFKNPRRIDMARVYAQYARRILDRLVGYKISPLLWSKVTRGLSAGRVQSVAVRLIVDREREIEAFEAKEYWKAAVDLAKSGTAEVFRAELRKIDGKPARVGNGEEAEQVRKDLEAASYRVEKVVERDRAAQPKPPFNTSTLQQQSSIRLRYRARRTMMIAQGLYEGVELGQEGPIGLITYMRTDSFRIADEARNACRSFIETAHGPQYLPKSPNTFKSSKGAQAAHEAVRPTDVLRTPDSVREFLTRDQYRLYKLIWDRFVASQMTPAKYAVSEIAVDGGRFSLQARGTRKIFDGYTRVWDEDASDSGEASLLPKVTEGDALEQRKVDVTRHFTQPPPRFTEATLVKTLEKLGIGRPSTYAPIISTIQDRGYVRLTDRKFTATEIGKVVTDLLVTHFPKILEVEFTSLMETELDRIEDASIYWVKVLREFYVPFQKDLEKAARDMPDLKKNPVASGHKCGKCGAEMVFRLNKHGRFLGCSAYPACRNIVALDDKGVISAPVETSFTCDLCGKPMLLRTGRRGRFLGCSAYPECRGTLSVDKDGNPIRPEPTGIKCEKCGAEMVLKRGRRGPFMACSGYPACRNTKPVRKDRADDPDSAPEAEAGAGADVRTD